MGVLSTSALQLAEGHLTRSLFRQIVARNEEGLAWFLLEPRVRGKDAHEQARAVAGAPIERRNAMVKTLKPIRRVVTGN